MDGWMNGWMDEWMDGWMDGWTDGRTDGRTDGWMDVGIGSSSQCLLGRETSPSHRKKNGLTDKHTSRLIDIPPDRQTGRRKDRQTNGMTNRRTGRTVDR